MVQDNLKESQNLLRLAQLQGDSLSRTDYEKAVQSVEHLVEHDPSNPLIDTICAKIDAYENNAPEFAAFNEFLAQSDYEK